MPEARFTIRFRRARRPGRLAVVVEDESGVAYLFSRRGCRFRLKRLRMGDRPPSPDLSERGWRRLPEVSPYSLAELRHLLAWAAARMPGGRCGPACDL